MIPINGPMEMEKERSVSQMMPKTITADGIRTVDYVRRVWQYRSLIRVLAKRDVKIKYSQTFFGVIWSVLQPLIAVLIYTVFFYWILGIETGNVPYPLFVLPGVIGWFQFTGIVNNAGMSLQENPDLMRRIEFPKLVLPISKALSGLLEVGITFIIMAVMMFIYDYPFTWRILFVPLFVLLNVITGLSVAVWLAALTVRYRDFHHIIPYLISFGIWVTPVFYPTTILPAGAESYLHLNPIATIIEGYRWALLGEEILSWTHFFEFIFVGLIMYSGLALFHKTEKSIVDDV